jgi:hypothetical protein
MNENQPHNDHHLHIEPCPCGNPSPEVSGDDFDADVSCDECGRYTPVCNGTWGAIKYWNRERNNIKAQYSGKTKEELDAGFAKFQSELAAAKAEALQEKEHHEFYRAKVSDYMGAEMQWQKAVDLRNTEIIRLREENTVLRAAQKICQDCDFPTSGEVSALKEDVRVFREALEWVRDVSACDYEYRVIARKALAVREGKL